MKNKANLFLDKRIGERDAKLSAEDKMIARYCYMISCLMIVYLRFNFLKIIKRAFLDLSGIPVGNIELYRPKSFDEY